MESTILIDSIAFGGSGVGRLPDGRVCFVPFTLPAERAVVRSVTEKKSFVEAEVVRLSEVSPRRVRPRCAVFGDCGGCVYQHMPYDLQLEVKTAQVADLMRRIGGFQNLKVLPAIGSPREWEYRNRIAVHIEDGQVGFHHRRSRRIVPVSSCPIAAPEINARLAEVAAHPPAGRPRLTIRPTGDIRGFSQVNDSAAPVLRDVVAGLVPSAGAHLIDAYCGSGFFAKHLRDRFSRTTGIEWSEPAVRIASTDAIENETYLRAAVEHVLRSTLSSAPPADSTLLVDPPAEGLPDDVIHIILNAPPAHFVYVSCDPATLARDLKKLRAAYEIQVVQPVDMFPQTAEIEVAVSCRKR